MVVWIVAILFHDVRGLIAFYGPSGVYLYLLRFIISQSSPGHVKAVTQISQARIPKINFSFHNIPPLLPDQHKKETPSVQAQLKENRS